MDFDERGPRPSREACPRHLLSGSGNPEEWARSQGARVPRLAVWLLPGRRKDPGFPLTTCGNDRRRGDRREGRRGLGWAWGAASAFGERRKDPGFPLTLVPDGCYRGTGGNDRREETGGKDEGDRWESRGMGREPGGGRVGRGALRLPSGRGEKTLDSRLRLSPTVVIGEPAGMTEGKGTDGKDEGVPAGVTERDWRE